MIVKFTQLCKAAACSSGT